MNNETQEIRNTLSNERWVRDLTVRAFVQASTHYQVDGLCLQCCHRYEFAQGFIEKFLDLLYALHVSAEEIEEAVGNEEWNETWRAMVKAKGYPQNLRSHWWPGGCDNNSPNALASALAKALEKRYLRAIERNAWPGQWPEYGRLPE